MTTASPSDEEDGVERGKNLRLGIRCLRYPGRPVGPGRTLQALVGEQAIRFAELWRTKQLEYSFRRGLMQRYVDFDACTRQALLYTQQALRCDLPESDQGRLLEAYLYLPTFPEVTAALTALKAQDHRLMAFTNGVEVSIRALLNNAGVLPYLEDVVSVDDLRTFKPDPAVYAYLARRAGHAGRNLVGVQQCLGCDRRQGRRFAGRRSGGSRDGVRSLGCRAGRGGQSPGRTGGVVRRPAVNKPPRFAGLGRPQWPAQRFGGP